MIKSHYNNKHNFKKRTNQDPPEHIQSPTCIWRRARLRLPGRLPRPVQHLDRRAKLCARPNVKNHQKRINNKIIILCNAFSQIKTDASGCKRRHCSASSPPLRSYSSWGLTACLASYFRVSPNYNIFFYF